MTIDPSEAVHQSISYATNHSVSPLTIDMAYQTAWETMYQALTVILAYMPEDDFHRLLENSRETVALRLERDLVSIFGHNAFETFEVRPRTLE